MGPVLPAPLGSGEVRALAGPKKIAIPAWKEYLKSIKIIHLNIEWKQDLLQWAMHRNIQKENNCTPFPDRCYHYHWDFEEERKKTAAHLRSSLPAHMIFKKKYITKIMSRGSPAAAAQAFQWNPIPSSHRLPTQTITEIYNFTSTIKLFHTTWKNIFEINGNCRCFDYPGALNDDLEGGRLMSGMVEGWRGSSSLCTSYRETL